jgi:hypothetical protein
MIRRLAKWGLATLLLLSATAGTVAAQGRGRGGFAGAGTRTAPGPAVVRGQAVSAARSPAFNHPTTAPASRFVARPQRQVIIAPPYWGLYGGYYSGLYDPYPYVTSPPYHPVSPYVSSYEEAPDVATSRSPSEVELSYQVEQLTREVERLRQDQAAAALRQSAPPTPRAIEPPPVPITLVFRDGHRFSIQNYAIVRDTLWVVEQRMSTKIDLSELDLAATQQANLGRVLLLPVPAK